MSYTCLCLKLKNKTSSGNTVDQNKNNNNNIWDKLENRQLLKRTMSKSKEDSKVSYTVMTVKLNSESGKRVIRRQYWCFFEHGYRNHKSKNCPVITPIKRCWHCNLPGHIARRCRVDNILRFEKLQGKSRKIFCMVEKKWGWHNSKDCPKRLSGGNQEKGEVKTENKIDNRIFCHFERRWGNHLSRNCPKQFPERGTKTKHTRRTK